MAKKDYIIIIDTETAKKDMVADFAAVISDRRGNVQTQCAVLVKGIYDNRTEYELFSDPTCTVESIWHSKRMNERYAAYDNMVKNGVRMIASGAAINRWLDKVKEKYDPYLTAYNLPFDLDKCKKTGIDLTMFTKRFCLWAVSATRWAHTKKYRNFALSVHAFNNPTKRGNMTYKANAETMARFVLDIPDFPDEPHTALEDVIDYELPILVKAIKGQKLKSLADLKTPAWQNMQVKNHYTAN